MFKSVDLKSVVIGGLLVLLVVISLGGAPWTERETCARFQMHTVDNGTFILDTVTGQAWVYIAPPDVISNTPRFFEPKGDPNLYVPIQ